MRTKRPQQQDGKTGINIPCIPMKKCSHRSFQRDYAKNPFGTGGKEADQNLENYRKKWSAMYFPPELPGKEREKTSEINIKTIKRVAFKMPILRLKGDYGHFKKMTKSIQKELCEDFSSF